MQHVPSQLLSPRAVVVNWYSGFSAGEIDAALTQHSHVVELVDLGRERLHASIGDVAVWMTAWRVAFSDARFTDVRVEEIGWAVSSAATLEGTHDGPLCGVPATGRRIALPMTVVHHLTARGLLTRHFVHYDATELFAQLGVPVPLGCHQLPGGVGNGAV